MPSATTSSSLVAQPPAAFVFDVFGTLTTWRDSVATELQETCTRLVEELSSAGSSHSSVPAETIARARKLTREDWDLVTSKWRQSYYDFCHGNQRALDENSKIHKNHENLPRHASSRTQPPYVNIDEFHLQSLKDILSAEPYKIIELFQPQDLQHLSFAWHRLPPRPDTAACMEGLRKGGYMTATLSNGNVRLLLDLQKNGNWKVDTVISSEMFGTYKPHASVYEGACEFLGYGKRTRPLTTSVTHTHNHSRSLTHTVTETYQVGKRSSVASIPETPEPEEKPEPEMIHVDQAKSSDSGYATRKYSYSVEPDESLRQMMRTEKRRGSNASRPLSQDLSNPANPPSPNLRKSTPVMVEEDSEMTETAAEHEEHLKSGKPCRLPQKFSFVSTPDAVLMKEIENCLRPSPCHQHPHVPIIHDAHSEDPAVKHSHDVLNPPSKAAIEEIQQLNAASSKERANVVLVAAHLNDLRHAKKHGMRTVYVARDREENVPVKATTREGIALEHPYVDFWCNKEEGLVSLLKELGLGA